MIGTPVFKTPAPSPCKDNYTVTLSLNLKCFTRLENTFGEILDHSSIQNLSRSLISFACSYGLPSSIPTTGD